MQLFMDAVFVIHQSETFKCILDLLLVLGNVMNFGSFRGSASGFRISSLNNVTKSFIISNFFYI